MRVFKAFSLGISNEIRIFILICKSGSNARYNCHALHSNILPIDCVFNLQTLYSDLVVVQTDMDWVVNKHDMDADINIFKQAGP